MSGRRCRALRRLFVKRVGHTPARARFEGRQQVAQDEMRKLRKDKQLRRELLGV